MSIAEPLTVLKSELMQKIVPEAGKEKKRGREPNGTVSRTEHF